MISQSFSLMYFLSIKNFVKEGVKKNFVIKIKHGAELDEDIEDSEKQLLQNAIGSELKEFTKKEKVLKKQITLLEKLIKEYNKYSDKQKLAGLNKIARVFFKVQSNYLDQLELIKISKDFESDGAVVTFGKDIFIMTASKRAFAYPEDFGLSRWKIETEEKKTISIPKEELLIKDLLELNTNILTKEIFDKTNKILIKKYKLKIKTNNEIINLLEKQKSNHDFSLTKISFLIDVINRL